MPEGGCQLVFCYVIKEQEVVVVHPVERLFSGSDLPLFVPRGLGFIDPLHESVQKGQKWLPQICIQRTMQVYVLRVLCRGAAGTRLAAVGRPAFCTDSCEIAAGDASRLPALHITGVEEEEPCRIGMCRA